MNYNKGLFIRMTEDEVRLLKKVSGGNVSKWIREIIQLYSKQDEEDEIIDESVWN